MDSDNLDNLIRDYEDRHGVISDRDVAAAEAELFGTSTTASDGSGRPPATPVAGRGSAGGPSR
ncbi:hypothetical protein ABH925_004339 [Streptacidiphilus sp. EB129]